MCTTQNGNPLWVRASRSRLARAHAFSEISHVKFSELAPGLVLFILSRARALLSFQPEAPPIERSILKRQDLPRILQRMTTAPYIGRNVVLDWLIKGA